MNYPGLDRIDYSQHQDNLQTGIEERKDSNGRTFYVNHYTRTTSWTLPASWITQEQNNPKPIKNKDGFSFVVFSV